MNTYSTVTAVLDKHVSEAALEGMTSDLWDELGIQAVTHREEDEEEPHLVTIVAVGNDSAERMISMESRAVGVIKSSLSGLISTKLSKFTVETV